MSSSEQSPRPFSVMVVTQNLGSIECAQCKDGVTDSIKAVTTHWIESFNAFIQSQAASAIGASLSKSPGDVTDTIVDVLVVNVQEIGGKKFNGHFNKYLAQQVHKLYPEAGWCSGLLMPNTNDDDTFTAMGTVIFVSPRAVPLTSLLSVKHRAYIAVADDPSTYAGNQQYLFHGAKFSNAEKSRKGFLLTSLRVGHTIMNFVNLHLFHDADNSVAVSESPSRYTSKRHEAFLEAILEIQPVVDLDRDPLFLAGDFNLRLDGHQLLKYLKRSIGAEVTMDKKAIDAPASFWEFMNNSRNQAKLGEYDLERQTVMDIVAKNASVELAEFPIRFMPTYLYEDSGANREERNGQKVLDDRQYKHERLPAWCDRIFFNPAALALISKAKPPSKGTSGAAAAELQTGLYAYDAVATHAMDHKSVFLQFVV